MALGSSAAKAFKRLEGKVAIITGGAGGIGASTVQLFHEHGAKVVIADIQDNQGQTISNTLGENVSYVHCDISKEDQVRNLVDATISRHGKLDIMFNNAGIMDRYRSNICDTKDEDLHTVLNVNLYGAFYGAKHATRVMKPQRQGCILFTASACTKISGVASHPYTMSKYGILGLANNLCAELGQYGIRVNCISPSGVFTGMTLAGVEQGITMETLVERVKEAGKLKGQILTAEGVARAALYLAGDDANYVSGHNIILDGGYSAVTPLMIKAFN